MARENLQMKMIIRWNNQWLTAWVGSEMMMMSADSGFYLSLSETGGRIWELLKDDRTIESVCRALSDEYQIAPSEASPAVLLFIEQMLREQTLYVDAYPTRS